MSLAYKFCLLMQRDAKFLAYRPSQLAAASLMVALNLTQERKAERSNLNFKFVSADELTDIIQNATGCRDIVVGGPGPRPEYGFLGYPVPWC